MTHSYGLEYCNNLGEIAIDPANPNTLYVNTATNVVQGLCTTIVRSTDSGANWSSFNTGLTDTRVQALAIDSSGLNVYAGTNGTGVFHYQYSSVTPTPTPSPSPSPTPSPTPTPQKRPLIFIPGIAGSVLRATTFPSHNVWPSEPIEYDNLSLEPGANAPNFAASDVIRFSNVAGDIYGTLLLTLTSQGGYREYQGSEDPLRRTSAGCDLTQKSGDPANNPSLFVFAYDWRKSSVDNANALADYVGCVRKFYPDSNTKIDVLTHSMGGLVARRYLVTHPTDHHVGKFITIAAPWLGSPKSINVLETGKFLDSGFGQKITSGTFKRLSEFFPGVHELLPSEFYFALGGRPYVLDGKTINTYDQFVNLMDLRFPRSKPGTADRLLHGRQGQDDGRQPPADVENVHLYGVRGASTNPNRDTIGTVGISRVCKPGQDLSKCDTRYVYSYTSGDLTVPLLSSVRRGIGPGLDMNSAGAVLIPFFSANNPDFVNHTTLTSNPEVLNTVLNVLRTSASALSSSASRAQAEIDTSPSRVSYYLRLSGATSIDLSDSNGHHSNPLSDPPDSGILNTVSNPTGEESGEVILPLDQAYTLTITAAAEPVTVEISKESDQPDQVVKYEDVALAAGIRARIRLTPQGVEGLFSDTDGDGVFETQLSPTVSTSGAAALDVTPPQVTVSCTAGQNAVQVSVQADDPGSGVKGIYLSLNGSTFSSYTSPFTVNPNTAPIVYAFAEDNLANRSSLVTYYPSLTGNQVDNAQFFVRQHYLDFLNREPDPSGLSFWANEITSCGGNTQCQEVKRINVSAAFFLSIEFQQTGYLAYRTHKAAFGNIIGKPVPITRDEMFLDMQVIGSGVIVNAVGWEQKLEQNKQTYFNQLASSTHFATLYPESITAEQFVDALNSNADGTLSQAERDALVSELKNGAKTRGQVLRVVAEDPDLSKAELNKAFVLMQYYGYLRRNPDDQPDHDFSGWLFWLTKLDQFNGNFIQAEMVKAFLSADEYKKRFVQ
jgi:pimeloyl-ACP methyl ester carboxylesterase